jgi:hypothetical protein
VSAWNDVRNRHKRGGAPVRQSRLLPILALASIILLAPYAVSASTPSAAPDQFVVPVNTPLGYEVEIGRQNSHRAPFTGALVIRLSPQGIISGVYASDSIRPDPLFGHQVPVTGSISSGNQIRLQIGVGSVALTVRGNITQYGIAASAANASFGILDFAATRVHLQTPPAQT